MAQSFKNNLPLLEEIGQFGSLRSPEPAAARYIGTKLNKNFRLLYKDFELLTDDQRKSEYIMLALRMPEGVKKAALTVAQYERTMEYIKSGHVIEKHDSLALTPKGRLIADRLTHEMLR